MVEDLAVAKCGATTRRRQPSNVARAIFRHPCIILKVYIHSSSRSSGLRSLIVVILYETNRVGCAVDMINITLVCTAHRENGHCNAEELLKILRGIEPGVIFEEMRAGEFDFYLQGGSVEAHAIARYRDPALFPPVPVDRYDVPLGLLHQLKKDFDRVLDRVLQDSQEYRNLDEENDKDVNESGFSYLNSDAFASRSSQMSAIEDAIISGTNHRDLIQALKDWRQLIRKREVEMVRSVYEYCRKHDFDRGVFLVGAAHKTGIVKLAENYASREPALITWHFAYDRLCP